MVLNPIIQVDSYEAIKEFVKQGLGIGFLPAWLIQAELAEGSLSALSLGRRHLTHTWGVSHWQDRPLEHVQNIFLKLCGKAAEKITLRYTASIIPSH